MAALNTRVHNRINELDKKVDDIELSVAKNYVSRTVFHFFSCDLDKPIEM